MRLARLAAWVLGFVSVVDWTAGEIGPSLFGVAYDRATYMLLHGTIGIAIAVWLYGMSGDRP